jgi:hypothetical protein
MSLLPPASKVSAEFRKLNPHLYVAETVRKVPRPESQQNQAPALGGAISGKAESLFRTRVRFTGYRVRPLDPDNFAGGCKDLLDGLRHAQLIPGDEAWRIIFETEQVHVRKFSEERTEIEIQTP